MMGLGSCWLFLFLCCGFTEGYRVPGSDPRSSERTLYWEVFPELRSAGQRLTPQMMAQGLPDQIQLSLAIDGKAVRMELQHNPRLLPHYHALTYYLPNGTRVTERYPEKMNCYYHGRVEGKRGPWSSLSLCSGLRGTIITPDHQYIIEPIPGDPLYKHILRPDIDRRSTTCGTQDATRNVSVSYQTGRMLLSLASPTSTPQHVLHQTDPPVHWVRRDVVNEMKYVELAMVADHSEYKMIYSDVKNLHTRMLEIANKMDAFYRELNIRVVLVEAEVWSLEDKILVSTNPAETLNRFLSWRKKDLLPRVHHDNAQLLTGVRFKGTSVGMATMSSMCSEDRSGGVTMDHSVSILGVASTMAHQLGHNLGMNHDPADGSCGHPNIGKQWLMEQSGGFMPGLEFSNCSLTEVTYSLRQGGGMCLYDVPSPRKVFGEPRCGNLVVEEGEQCDCGLTQECTDPCCNASSCQLVSGAECASDGLCCEQCKIKVLGSLCRETLGECDLPEYCNGATPHCPPNVYIQNGEPCGGGPARCYQGECRTLQNQCQSLWGPGSSPAPDFCFTKLNMKGDKYGNCGRAANGTYLPCAQRNVLCGTVQCHGGRERPVLASAAETVMFRFSVNRSSISCRGTYFNLGEDVWEPVLVKAGTPCGEGQVCINQQCQDVIMLQAKTCEERCGGHGVCNSNSNCHCDHGWAPPACETSGPGGSVDSGPVALEHAGSTAPTAVIVILLLVLIVVLLAVCFMKRHILQRKLGTIFTKSSNCQYSVAETSSQPRPLRPPQPPQCTELQVMSSSHQVSAPRKPPPPKKPLPLGPKLPCEDPVHRSPAYPDHIIALPTRHAPPPPYTARNHRV